MTISIGVLGYGRMGQAIIGGLAKNEYEISIFDPYLSDDARNMAIIKGFKINPEEYSSFDILLVAVKPQTFAQVCSSSLPKMLSAETLLVSIMAGISIDKIKEMTGASNICRTMPNTPGQIGEGVTAYITSENLSENSIKNIENLLSPLGMVLKLDNEKQIDAVTSVSGCGPAYVFHFVDALTAAGISEGLSEEMAQNLARQTIIGSAALLKASKNSPLELRAEVTSPGGATAAALDVLMGGNALVNLMKRTAEAAVKRSKELGK